MTIPLPDPFAAYFAANSDFDVDAMLAPFAEDAVVVDEARTHRGHAEIRRWIEEATLGARAVATPVTAQPEGAHGIVEADVSGAFPGSPVRLTFRYTLANERIARLEIA